MHRLAAVERLDARLGGDPDLAGPMHGDWLEYVDQPMIASIVVARFIGLKTPHEWGKYTTFRKSAYIMSF